MEVSQLWHPLCHTEQRGCPSPGAAPHDPHPMSMPRRCCHIAASAVTQGTLFPLHCWAVVPAHSHPAWENSKLLRDRSNAAPFSAEQISLRSLKMQEDSKQRATSSFLARYAPVVFALLSSLSRCVDFVRDESTAPGLCH